MTLSNDNHNKTSAQSPSAYSCYREYLRAELTRRLRENAQYSLRAFARFLKLQPSQLSQVIKGTKRLSADSATQIAQRLQLCEKDTEYLRALVQYDQAKSPLLKDQLHRKLQHLNTHYEVRDLSLDVFRALSDWYHLPLLEMSDLRDFTLTAQTAASRLSISPVQAAEAIDRLLALELLERTPEGRLQKASPHINFKSEIPNLALRNFHRQMLKKAEESIETQTPQEKIMGSQTLSVNPSRLPEVLKLTEEYLEKVSRLFEKDPTKTETYHLGVQFFRLTSPEQKTIAASKTPTKKKSTPGVKKMKTPIVFLFLFILAHASAVHAAELQPADSYEIPVDWSQMQKEVTLNDGHGKSGRFLLTISPVDKGVSRVKGVLPASYGMLSPTYTSTAQQWSAIPDFELQMKGKNYKDQDSYPYNEKEYGTVSLSVQRTPYNEKPRLVIQYSPVVWITNRSDNTSSQEFTGANTLQLQFTYEPLDDSAELLLKPIDIYVSNEADLFYQKVGLKLFFRFLDLGFKEYLTSQQRAFKVHAVNFAGEMNFLIVYAKGEIDLGWAFKNREGTVGETTGNGEAGFQLGLGKHIRVRLGWQMSDRLLSEFHPSRASDRARKADFFQQYPDAFQQTELIQKSVKAEIQANF